MKTIKLELGQLWTKIKSRFFLSENSIFDFDTNESPCG